MESKPKNIQFINHQNPNSQFDLIRLENFFSRENLDHSPAELHRVEFYVILFVENGEGCHTIDFKDFDCSGGTLITIRKDQLHKFFSDTTMKGSLLLFTDDFLVSYLDDMEVHKTMLLFNELLVSPRLQLSGFDLQVVSQIVNRIRNEYFDVNDKYSLSIVRSELHILITNLFRIKDKNQNIDINRKYIKEFISLQHLIEVNVVHTVRVNDYAKMMGVSTKTLNTITKSIIHKSAKVFIDEICVKQIKRLLINTELSVKEIAYQSGFQETTNFYKYFKRQTQSTPEQFRAAH